MNVKGALDRLGIKVERVTRGQHALSLSPLSDPEQMVTAPWRQLLEDFYWQFVDKVAQGRQKTRAEIHAVAQGRVWTGRDAVAKGLVDELGGLQRALEVARQLAHVAPEDTLEILELPRHPRSLRPSRRPLAPHVWPGWPCPRQTSAWPRQNCRRCSCRRSTS